MLILVRNKRQPTDSPDMKSAVGATAEHMESAVGASSRDMKSAVGATARLDIEKAVGARVRELRRSRGLSQTQLGQQLGTLGYPMEQPTVYKLENGTRPLRLNEAAALAAVFKIDVADLLNADEHEEERRAALHELLDLDHAITAAQKELDQAEERQEKYQDLLSETTVEVFRARDRLNELNHRRVEAGSRFNALQREAKADGE